MHSFSPRQRCSSAVSPPARRFALLARFARFACSLAAACGAVLPAAVQPQTLHTVLLVRPVPIKPWRPAPVRPRPDPVKAVRPPPVRPPIGALGIERSNPFAHRVAPSLAERLETPKLAPEWPGSLKDKEAAQDPFVAAPKQFDGTFGSLYRPAQGPSVPLLLNWRPPIDAKKAAHVASMLDSSKRSSDGMFTVLHVTRVEDPQNATLYVVQSDGEPPVYIDTARGIADMANRIGAATGARSVYIFVDGPTQEKDVRALAVSLGNVERHVQTPIVMANERVFSGQSTARSGSLADALTWPLNGPVTLTRIGRTAVAADGYHEQRVSLGTPYGETTLSIVSKSRAMLERFFVILAQLFARPDHHAALSTLAVVQKARVQLARELGVSLAHVDDQLGVNIENSQLAGLDGGDGDDGDRSPLRGIGGVVLLAATGPGGGGGGAAHD